MDTSIRAQLKQVVGIAFPTYSVTSARAGISLVLQGLGTAASRADQAAQFMVNGEMSVADFTAGLIGDEVSLNATIVAPPAALLPTSSAALIEEFTTLSANCNDAAGQIQVGSTATFWARVEPRYREVDVSGVLEKTTHMVILNSTTASGSSEFAFRSVQIFLPADITTPRRPRVTHFCYDEVGVLDHIEVFV